MKKTISVVIPALNEEGEIEECLQSLTGQSFPDFELIVVDNGSTDSTCAVARDYGARVIVEPRRGVSRARQAALKPRVERSSPPPMQIRWSHRTGWSGYTRRLRRIRSSGRYSDPCV